MHCQLSEITSFQHEPVIQRFKKEYPHKAKQAQEIFADLMIFFWASEKHHLDQLKSPHDSSLQFSFIMDEEMRDIDLMWHVFLLYTKDYMEFCEKYFGQYIHHLPDIVPGMPQDPEAFEDNLRKFLNYCYDLLGEQTVSRWFSETIPA